jgi:hypothetical protein
MLKLKTVLSNTGSFFCFNCNVSNNNSVVENKNKRYDMLSNCKYKTDLLIYIIECDF